SFKTLARGIIRARIGETFVVAGRFLLVGGGLKNRGDQRAGFRLRWLARVDRSCGEFHVQLPFLFSPARVSLCARNDFVILSGVPRDFDLPATFAGVGRRRRTSLGCQPSLLRPRREILRLRGPALRAKPKARATPLRMTLRQFGS